MARRTANDMPGLTARTVVIIGATGGIGLVTARDVASAKQLWDTTEHLIGNALTVRR